MNAAIQLACCRRFVPTSDQSQTRTFQGSVMCSPGDSRSSNQSSAARRPTAGSSPTPISNPSLKQAAKPRHASMSRATWPWRNCLFQTSARFRFPTASDNPWWSSVMRDEIAKVAKLMEAGPTFKVWPSTYKVFPKCTRRGHFPGQKLLWSYPVGRA